MRNPNIRSAAPVDIERIEPLSFESFNFSEIVSRFSDQDKKGMENNTPMVEVRIKIDDKEYRCVVKRWTGYILQEILFELYEDENTNTCILEGVIQLSVNTEASNASARASVKRNHNQDKENNALRSGRGIDFYKKELDFINSESKKYIHGLLHRAVHDPREGLSSEKWDRNFGRVLEDRGYEKIKQGEWQKFYNEPGRLSDS